jgi:hypothetical protein
MAGREIKLERPALNWPLACSALLALIPFRYRIICRKFYTRVKNIPHKYQMWIFPSRGSQYLRQVTVMQKWHAL